MNKKVLWIIIGSVVLLGGIFAYRFFSGSNKHLIFVPVNATMVMRFNVKSLANKISEDGAIKNTKLYKTIEKEYSKDNDGPGSAVIAQLLKDPSSTGINIFSDVYYYLYNHQNISYNAFVFDMKDLEDFNKTILKFNGAKDKLVKGKDYNYIKLSSRNILAWNSTGLLYLNKENSWFYDENPTQTIEKTVKGFMKMKKEATILNDKDFIKYDDNDDDMSLYISYDKFTRILNPSGEIDMATKNVVEMMKGVKMGVGVSFEDDAIVSELKVFGDTKHYDKFNYMGRAGLSEATANALCKEQLLGLISLNLNVDKLLSFMGVFTNEERSIRRDIEEFAGEYGLTSKQLLEAFGQDLALALLDFETRTYTTMDYSWSDFSNEGYTLTPVTKTSVMPVMTFAVSVKNKKVVSQLLNHPKFKLMSDGRRYMNLPLYDSLPVYAVLNDKVLFLSNSNELSASMQKDGHLGKIKDQELVKSLKENPGNFYLDLDVKKYTKLTTNLAGNSGRQFLTYFENYMAIFKDISYSGNGYLYEQRINLKKGKGNSLYRLVKQMDELPMETW